MFACKQDDNATRQHPLHPGSATPLQPHGITHLTHPRVRHDHPTLVHHLDAPFKLVPAVARLLVQLAIGRRGGVLVAVDQARGELDADGLDGRAVLEDDGDRERAGGVAEEGGDCDGCGGGAISVGGVARSGVAEMKDLPSTPPEPVVLRTATSHLRSLPSSSRHCGGRDERVNRKELM